MQVRRYDPYGMGSEMAEDDEGDYVLYTDAVKMQRDAFVEGAWYGRVVSGPIFDNHVAQRGAEAEAARRYKEE